METASDNLLKYVENCWNMLKYVEILTNYSEDPWDWSIMNHDASTLYLCSDLVVQQSICLDPLFSSTQPQNQMKGWTAMKPIDVGVFSFSQQTGPRDSWIAPQMFPQHSNFCCLLGTLQRDATKLTQGQTHKNASARITFADVTCWFPDQRYWEVASPHVFADFAGQPNHQPPVCFAHFVPQSNFGSKQWIASRHEMS